MKETTISVVSSKRCWPSLASVTSTCASIRDALGVRISARDGSIHVEGDEAAVARATGILEQLQARVNRDGELAPEDVACVLADIGPAGHRPRDGRQMSRRWRASRLPRHRRLRSMPGGKCGPGPRARSATSRRSAPTT